eukprot:TRINITY_DN81046_c0_g1_i1.p1 TRINITY_DN81046_c0_g1~~TRINITY_DN81046_c0_g1_i1.p1  ORF type:complete len:843 (-),score=149.48 TRINITY_DN81046_c0_g1_i1:145-2673(-)
MSKHLKKVPEGYFSRICRVQGRICGAGGLQNTDGLGLSDPFVVVKGIRSNSHLANIYVTSARQNTLSPTWDEDFDFDVPKAWGLIGLVGLKIQVFDSDESFVNFSGSDDFLGGADVDISTAIAGRTVTHDLDLRGLPIATSKGKKPRLTMTVTIYREVNVKPLGVQDALLHSLKTMTYVREIGGVVVKADNLRNADSFFGKSDPQCIVRVVMLDGSVKEICRTEICSNELNPKWNEEFHAKFSVHEQPLMIMFDVWDSDDPNKPSEETGEHLGTAIVPLLSFLPPAKRQQKVLLLPDAQLWERRLKHKSAEYQDNGRQSQQISAADEEEAERIRQKELDQLLAQRTILHKYFPKSMGKVDFLKMAVKERFFKPKEREGDNRSTLTIELRTRAKSEDMPHIDIYQQPVDVADEEDAEGCLESKYWDRGQFEPPPEIMGTGRPPRGKLWAAEKVVCIYGRVHDASGLPAADLFGGKSDPYCVVQGVSRVGKVFFIHKTRHINDTLCPRWNEFFHYTVPLDIEIARVVFSIFDSDVGDILESMSQGDDSDDFLGRTSIDLSYICSGDIQHEDCPVIGCPNRFKQKLTSGFRRTASMGIELWVERRLQPRYEIAVDDQLAVLPRRSHTISRHPDGSKREFRDPLQVVERQPDWEMTAPEVLWNHSTGQLIEAAERSNFAPPDWITIPEQDTRTQEDEGENKEDEEEAEDEEVASPKKKKKATDIEDDEPDSAEEARDLSGIRKLRRPKTLKTIASRFGVHPAVYNEDRRRGKVEPDEVKLSDLVVFDERKAKTAMSSFRFILDRAEPNEVTMRRPKQDLLMESTMRRSNSWAGFSSQPRLGMYQTR